MSNTNWISVPEAGDNHNGWTGRIWPEGEGIRRWRFEAIRAVKSHGIYDQGVFGSVRPVSVALDYQQPSTLIRPIVSSVDPGKIGSLHPEMRTKIAGTFQGLLTGCAIDDEHEAMFSGLGFESSAFRSWYGNPRIKDVVDDKYQLKSVEVAPNEEKTFEVPDFGTVEAFKGTSFHNGPNSSKLIPQSVFRLKFTALRSLDESIDVCLGLELVFGFLAGFRPKLPIFCLWLPTDGTSMRRSQDPKLDLGGVHFRDEEPPHPLNRIHGCGWDEVGLEEVISAYLKAPRDLVNRIHAVQLGRWFATNLNDKFSAVMPTFEEYLQSRFKNEEEENFLHSQRIFFDYIDASADPEIAQFSKKHIQVKSSKAPSLVTLLNRAINTLRDSGFRFDETLPRRIAKRRATMFHSAPIMNDDDVQAFYEETRAVTFMLMLFTLKDFGVSLERLSKAYQPLATFDDFLPDYPLPSFPSSSQDGVGQ
ncbi:hypothetical protein [Acetobacter oryzoeni]|uniref:ApeA N-terminal domain-containing protein n=1 Tax=Acetobacter oryzoeni TaxID=2500548 RepID=A0A5B9GLE8_9PROT|nr:hypothetical protein [Acetobacter oryzoeni]MCP1203734.1 hypothetical protein [Acetobacter oryzoeni]QEE86913.1 hypothetical protein EOV40_014500 [Acetobacter oryzoeni]